MAQYVDNEVLYNDIVAWKTVMRETGNPVRMPDSIGKAITDIAVGFSGYWKFAGYTACWKDEMVSDAIEVCVKGLVNFDEHKYKNPHAYITMSCFNAFIQRIKQEKKAQAVKYKYFITNFYTDESASKVVDEEFLQDIHQKLSDYDTSLIKESVSAKKEYSGPNLDMFFESLDLELEND